MPKKNTKNTNTSKGVTPKRRANDKQKAYAKARYIEGLTATESAREAKYSEASIAHNLDRIEDSKGVQDTKRELGVTVDRILDSKAIGLILDTQLNKAIEQGDTSSAKLLLEVKGLIGLNKSSTFSADTLNVSFNSPKTPPDTIDNSPPPIEIDES